MKIETSDYIKLLTEKDKKNLSQKALKVCEEAGELAKVILPFDNAHGTTHRFVDRQRILEEVADIYLTSISVAYDLGFSDDEIEEMIYRKSLKWGDLQSREDVLSSKSNPDKIPYEIHVTVLDANKEMFYTACEKIGVKPIVLDLQTKDGKHVFEDVMSSSVHLGNNRSAYEEMTRISNALSFVGTVVREKIETVPWHPAAPSDEHMNPVMPTDCYFECHLGVNIKNDTEYNDIKCIASMCDAHLSRNIFKKHDDGSSTVMVTYRKYEGTYEDFQKGMAWLKLEIDRTECEIEKTIIEFSIYDTRVSHDAEWLKK
jgi:NTP pyrophosphatase (non-canonical NTP hydrolase)